MCNHVVKVDLYSTKKAGSNTRGDMRYVNELDMNRLGITIYCLLPNITN